MKIVMEYTIGDGCSWSSDCCYPIEHESLESAYFEFDEALKSCGGAIFYVFGITFIPYLLGHGNSWADFVPRFLTIDEWFAEGPQKLKHNF